LTQEKPMRDTISHSGAFELAALAATIADAKKAIDILVLDTGKVSSLTDYFVICSGESTTQIRTIAEEIKKAFRQREQEPVGMEQDAPCKWHLLDYGDVVIHIMQRSERQFYQLENFWSHADVVPAESWQALHQLQQAS
jgi:ribosome-associated protein